MSTQPLGTPQAWEAPEPRVEFSVFIHDDDIHTMDYVVESLLSCVTGMTPALAVELMLEAHNHGRARVITCRLEQAEACHDCLNARGLSTTIEPQQPG